MSAPSARTDPRPTESAVSDTAVIGETQDPYGAVFLTAQFYPEAADSARRGGGRLRLGDLGPDVVHVQPPDRVDDLVQCRRRQSTRLAEDQDAVTERHQRGDRSDVGRSGETLLGLGVDLAEHDVRVGLRSGLK